MLKSFERLEMERNENKNDETERSVMEKFRKMMPRHVYLRMER